MALLGPFSRKKRVSVWLKEFFSGLGLGKQMDKSKVQEHLGRVTCLSLGGGKGEERSDVGDACLVPIPNSLLDNKILINKKRSKYFNA